MIKRVVAAVLLGSMIGCTTLRPLADYRSYVENTQPTQLWITPRDAASLRLEGPRFLNDTLVGFVGGQYREFAPTDIRLVQVRQPAGGRTGLLVAAVAVVGVVIFAKLASGGPATYIPTPEDPPTTARP